MAACATGGSAGPARGNLVQVPVRVGEDGELVLHVGRIGRRDTISAHFGCQPDHLVPEHPAGLAEALNVRQSDRRPETESLRPPPDLLCRGGGQAVPPSPAPRVVGAPAGGSPRPRSARFRPRPRLRLDSAQPGDPRLRPALAAAVDRRVAHRRGRAPERNRDRHPEGGAHLTRLYDVRHSNGSPASRTSPAGRRPSPDQLDACRRRRCSPPRLRIHPMITTAVRDKVCGVVPPVSGPATGFV